MIIIIYIVQVQKLDMGCKCIQYSSRKT